MTLLCHPKSCGIWVACCYSSFPLPPTSPQVRAGMLQGQGEGGGPPSVPGEFLRSPQIIRHVR